MKNLHNYTLELQWTGDKYVDDTANERLYEVKIEGKPMLKGSADKPFFGDPSLHNPEDMLLSSLSACHMMSYLYVCRKHGLQILSYKDNPEGLLRVNPNGSGQFVKVLLKPIVEIKEKQQEQFAKELHVQAGKLCFIANSCNFLIEYDVQVIFR